VRYLAPAVLEPALFLLAATAAPASAQPSTPAVVANVQATLRQLPRLSLDHLVATVDPAQQVRVELAGRVELGAFASALSSSFARWSVGVQVDAIPRAAPRLLNLPLTSNGLLVARIGYGLFLGRPRAPPRGELFVYYDHQLRVNAGDDPGTIPPYNRHRVGVGATLFLGPQIGLHVDAHVGRSWATGVSLIFPSPKSW